MKDWPRDAVQRADFVTLEVAGTRARTPAHEKRRRS
jgi:hypothetical protein